MPVVNALRPQNSHFLLETSPGAPLAPIIQTLVTGGAQVEEVRKNRASLEEIFFDLVEDEQQETVL
jgi:hypothetical protein